MFDFVSQLLLCPGVLMCRQLVQILDWDHMVLVMFFQELQGFEGVDGPTLSSSMDSFFKAAVCDLDKLLDDFELNTGKSPKSICK